MQLVTLDWGVVVAFFALTLTVGLLVSRRAGKNSAEFFLSGRTMPWWLLGASMVATTFSTDTPNLVTDIVRQNGVAGNWEWWAFLLTGMLTVFVYAKLWRRSGVTTDIEFYELRYSGNAAAFLRGFRAVYLGVLLNILIMATVSLAAIKIGHVLLNLTPIQTILIASVVTVIFSAAGGFRAVILTDFVLFFLAMVGSVTAAVVALRLNTVGGLDGLLAQGRLPEGTLSLVPMFTRPDGSSNLDTLIKLLVIPLAVQWWSVWYPGSEPGGGGYIAQRMLSAKNEQHAVGATLFFNAAHYALRPWPWILVALCSLIVFPVDSQTDRKAAEAALASPAIAAHVEQWKAVPDSVDGVVRQEIERLTTQSRGLTSLQEQYPDIPLNKLGHDLAYPAMLRYLPAGLLGLVVASLIAAYMSTISTHLNWGSSYLVNDVWKRFVHRTADDREQVWVGRIATVLMMVCAGAVALWLQNAKEAFDILILMGAGTGSLFILRWFWWRVNPYSEITAMVVSFGIALYMKVWSPEWIGLWKLPLGVGITTLAWIVVTLVTPASDPKILRAFHRLTRPGGPGWQRVIEQARRDGETITGPEGGRSNLAAGILCMFLGCVAVYSALFGTGYWIYGKTMPATALCAVAALAVVLLVKFWKTVGRA